MQFSWWLLIVAAEMSGPIWSNCEWAQQRDSRPAVGWDLPAALFARSQVQLERDREDVARLHRVAQEEQRRPATRIAFSMQLYYFPELIQLRKVYPHGYHKHDKKVSTLQYSIGPSISSALDLQTLKRFGSLPLLIDCLPTTACCTRLFWTIFSKPALSRRRGRQATAAGLIKLVRFSTSRTSNLETLVPHTSLWSLPQKWPKITIPKYSAICSSSMRLSSSLAFGPSSGCGSTIKRSRRYRFSAVAIARTFWSTWMLKICLISWTVARVNARADVWATISVLGIRRARNTSPTAWPSRRRREKRATTLRLTTLKPKR